MAARRLLPAMLVVLLIGPGCGFLGDLLGTSEKPKISPPKRAKTRPVRVSPKSTARPDDVARAQEEVSPDAVIKKEQYRYVAEDKRDPFRPFIILARVKGEPPLPPLQRYDIAQLRLVGLILMGENSSAMVEDASGKGYVVSRGTRIGRRNGVVVRIEKDRVIVEEQYKDSAGNMKSKEVSIKLYAVEEEGR
ncbi:MAG: pilus assembly protein PilP [Deltaproteobacteria bacterium]|nr:pilus assembly protein PilP [Deltaproteobacteria bacterium]